MDFKGEPDVSTKLLKEHGQNAFIGSVTAQISALVCIVREQLSLLKPYITIKD